MNHIVIIKDFTTDIELLRDEPYCCNPSALSIPPVMHQSRGFIDMPARNWLRTAKAYDTATTLFFTLSDGAWDFKALDQPLF
jgi:hypothetical protein